jgi:5-methyltetrahydrofolate--homocysteine methyltransferase
VLVAKANVGQPMLVGMDVSYDTMPDDMAGFARRFAEAGANVIGACCGSTPPHLRAMAAAATEAGRPA